MKIAVAFYRAEGEFLDKLIRWWTKSPYSHCELMDGDWAYGCSSRDDGVRVKLMSWDKDTWDIIYISEEALGVRLEDAKLWFVKHTGQKYDWLGLLWFVLPFKLQNRKRWFCSEALADALKLEKSWKYSPGTLYTKLQEVKYIWSSHTLA